jgi:uncharacterized damage-inducible protein DinB
MSRRPAPTDYGAYYETYIRLVPDGDVAETLARQIDESLASYRAISDEQSRFRYAPDKWTIKQVLGHVSDAERVFAYRAMAIARGETTPLPSFDQDVYMAGADFDDRTWSSLVDELKTVREASISLFRSLGETVQDRRGIASEKEITPRALGFIIAGHERHHLSVLKAQYLAASGYPR